MVDSLKYAVAVLCLVIAIFKSIQYRQRGEANIANRYVIACFTLLGLAAFAIAPSTLRFISTFEPLPNLGRLLGNGMVIAAAWCVIAILAYTVKEPAKARRAVARHAVARHAVIAVVVIVAMGVLLVTGRTRFTIEFVTDYATRPAIVAYLVLFSAYCAAGLGAFLVLIRRYSMAAPERGALRAGLRTMMLGAFFGLLWALWKTVVLVIDWISVKPVAAEALVTAALSSTTAALIAVGGIVPLVIRYVRDPLGRARTRRYYRQLEPLWSAVHRALPQIQLAPATQDDELNVYRRLIEIRDANLALRVHCHPDVRGWAVDAARQDGITGDDVEVIAEAAVTAGAIEAHAAGVRYHGDSCAVETPHAGTGDVDAERDWLIRVSQAFAHHPIVARIRKRVRADVAAATAEQG